MVAIHLSLETMRHLSQSAAVVVLNRMWRQPGGPGDLAVVRFRA
jgi:hypothetical protein